MSEYSDEELEEIIDQVSQWGMAFSKSLYFEILTEEQKENSKFIITTFTEYMYTYHNSRPEEWDESGLEECCVYTLPRKISADESYYRSIAPVLSAFFTFIDKEGLLKHSMKLAKKVKEIDDEIVESSNDSSNWGMAKSFMMSAKREGVNIENQKEMNEYMISYNLRRMGSMKKSKKHVQKVSRNDPCPCGSGKKYKKCCGR